MRPSRDDQNGRFRRGLGTLQTGRRSSRTLKKRRLALQAMLEDGVNRRKGEGAIGVALEAKDLPELLQQICAVQRPLVLAT